MPSGMQAASSFRPSTNSTTTLRSLSRGCGGFVLTTLEGRPMRSDEKQRGVLVWLPREIKSAVVEAVIELGASMNDIAVDVIGVMPDATDFGVLQILTAASYGRSFADRGEASRVQLWLPLRPDSFFKEQRIELALGVRVVGLSLETRQLTLESGGTVAWDALLLATGAEPVHLDVPGGDLPQRAAVR